MFRVISQGLVVCLAVVGLLGAQESAGTVSAVAAKPLEMKGASAAVSVQPPEKKPISLEEYKALIASFEGDWKGEIRPSATEESGATYAERAAIAGRIIPAEISYAIKTDSQNRWELQAKTSFGRDGKKMTVQARTFLENGILRSVSNAGGKSLNYIGQLQDGKIIWAPDKNEKALAQRSSEWVEKTPSGDCLRTRTIEAFQGKNGPVYVQLDGYFYRANPTKPARIESFERSSSLLN